MTATRPRIAIPFPTAGNAPYNERCWQQYASAVEQSGGTPVAIPLSQDPSATARQASSCSGVVLPGSPADLHPQKYGQASEPKTAARDILREAVDELLLQDAFNLRKPVLGICYGHQSINVWKGGTLVQHLATQVDHEAGSTVSEAHTLTLTSEARHLRQAFKDAPCLVNSSHHQAVSRLGDGLRLAALSQADNVIEAFEAEDGFVVGVQWHPERSFETSLASRRLFALLVDAALAWHTPLVTDAPSLLRT